MAPKNSLVALLALFACYASSAPVPEDPKDVTLRLHFSGKGQGETNANMETGSSGGQNFPWKKPEDPKYVRT